MMHLKNDMNSSKQYILLILLYLTKMSILNAGFITVSETVEHVSARYKEKACGLHFLYTTAFTASTAFIFVKLQQQQQKDGSKEAISESICGEYIFRHSL